MKLQLEAPGAQFIFTGYGPGYVTINDVRHTQHVVVTSGKVEPWQVESFEALRAEDFARLLALEPEIVIFGTGDRLRFPPPALSRSLTAAGIGLEIMDSRAACRTYNIVAVEGRNAVAAILVG